MRIDSIFDTLIDFTNKKNLDKHKIIGVTIKEVCDSTGYARTAVSEDMSKLVREDKVIKIRSRPALFFALKPLENIFQMKLNSKHYDSIQQLEKEIEKKVQGRKTIEEANKKDPFRRIIGYNESLKPIIQKLKAAILYPPNGLNIMLTGESGVGKTLIAEQLHKFYEVSKEGNIPFVYFNCAEYFNNPELLTSHLFGYKKGSFTGADSDRKGLVEVADGGFFFLDEVHRLSSEGQEKLFTLLDKGYFSRMGESEVKRDVSIKFIFATTENIETVFLKTFLRRIPVIVHIPSLNERSMQEKIQLIINFFLDESNKIQKDIHVSYQTIKTLTFMDYDANIGEMKSDVQFICAQAYLETLGSSSEELNITSTFRESVIGETDAKEQLLLNEMVPYEGIHIRFDLQYSDIQQLLHYKKDHNDNFYNYLIKEFSDLKNTNMSTNDALAILQNKVDQLFDMDLFDEEENKNLSFNKIDEKFQLKVEKIFLFIEDRANIIIPERMKSILWHHLYSTIFFSREIHQDFYEYTSHLFLGKIENYNLVDEIVKVVSSEFSIILPETERIYYDLLLRKISTNDRKNERDENCGIIVVAHGASTATSMVEYTNILFSSNIMRAVDMPINQSVEETLDQVRTIIRRNSFKKLILMVDIGSLVYFGNVISKEFQIEVLLISNINLLSLLEVSREVIYETTKFDYLLPVLKEKKHRVSISKQGNFFDSKVLIISCITGVGTALKIERLLVNTFPEEMLENIRIVTLENSILEDINKMHSYVHSDEKLIGIIGTVKAEIPDVPFISLEDLLSGSGIELMMRLFGYDTTKDGNKKKLNRISAKYIQGLSIEAITDMITVLNPKSISLELTKIFSDICLQAKLKSDERKLLRFIIHCSCMIERLILYPEYDPTLFEVSYRELPDMVSVVKMAFRTIEVSYNIQLPPLEAKYIYELLFQNE